MMKKKKNWRDAWAVCCVCMLVDHLTDRHDDHHHQSTKENEFVIIYVIIIRSPKKQDKEGQKPQNNNYIIDHASKSFLSIQSTTLDFLPFPCKFQSTSSTKSSSCKCFIFLALLFCRHTYIFTYSNHFTINYHSSTLYLSTYVILCCSVCSLSAVAVDLMTIIADPFVCFQIHASSAQTFDLYS